jgi:TetR/AcrR family transcriptional regulator
VEPTSREKLLEVAEARFAQRGYSGTGMREVALAAGLGKSSLFHHFPSKAELYVAVIERVIARIEAHVLPALDGAGSVLARIERSVDALIDALAEHPTTARLLLRSLVEEDELAADEPPGAQEVEARIHALVARFVALLGEGVAAGELRAASAPDAVQTLIGATVYHFAAGEFGEAVLGGPLLSAEAVARRKREVKDLLLHGLASPSRAPKERPPS